MRWACRPELIRKYGGEIRDKYLDKIAPGELLRMAQPGAEGGVCRIRAQVCPPHGIVPAWGAIEVSHGKEKLNGAEWLRRRRNG